MCILISLFLLLSSISFSFSSIKAQTVCSTIQPTYNATANEGNPFRGFFPYIGEREPVPSLPYSMEYTYVALREMMIGDNQFNWTLLDSYLDDVKTRNHQLVMRLYVDYPNCCPEGQYTTGIPTFLLTGTGAVTITRGGQSGKDAGYGLPDYANPRLITAMEQAITALGARYDNDPRLAFIQVGLLGFWGEWHVWPVKPESQYFPSRVIQERILRAYNSSFRQTGVVVSADELKKWNRDDKIPPTTTDRFRIGWHDDDFAKNTYQADQPNLAEQFYTNLKHNGVENRWMKVPIGGEVQPSVQKLVFDPAKQGSTSFQPFLPAAAITHASWLLNEFAFDPDDNNTGRIAATRTASAALGYQFRISKIQFLTPTSCTASSGKSCVIISVTVDNVGNAPFYYPLTLVAIISGIEHTFATSPNSVGGGTSVTTSTTLIYTASSPSIIVTLALRSTRTLTNTFIRWANAGINQDGALVVSAQSTCGAIAGTTPSPTEKCMVYTNSGCSACTSVTGCGWCDTTSSCVAGGDQGPTTTTCDARNWNYLSSTCTPVGTSAAGGNTNITANVTSPPVTDSCALYTSAGCQSCTSFRTCGWCTSTRTCRTANTFDRFEGSADGLCPRQLWYPDTSYCISGAPANGTVPADRTNSASSVTPFYVAITSLLVVLALLW